MNAPGTFQATMNQIFVIVDHLTEYAHFILLKHPYTAKKVATTFVKEVVRLQWMPHSILSDRDPLFKSNFCQQLLKLQIRCPLPITLRLMVKKRWSIGVWNLFEIFQC